MKTLNTSDSLTQRAIMPTNAPLNGRVNQLEVNTRNNVFETLLNDNWKEGIPSRVGNFSSDARRWISELKTRFLTNSNLTTEKTRALIDLILWYEMLLTLQTKVQENSQSDGRPDLEKIVNGMVIKKINSFLHIQIYTREIEKNLIKLKGNTILSHEYVADFLRDIRTLQSLGLRAPHIAGILSVIDSHPNLEFDTAILEKYRSAVQSALNAHYWMDPNLQDSSLIQPNANIVVTPLKGHADVPIPNYRETSQDDHARDFNLSKYPVSIIDAMSSFNRSVIYDLTRTTPPKKQKRYFFSRHRKPDYMRITPDQDKRLKELLFFS